MNDDTVGGVQESGGQRASRLVRGFDRLFSTGQFVALSCVAFMAVALTGFVFLRADLQLIDRQIDDMARERGASLFNLIQLTREWNARHGGVYVPITEQTKPNPYLKHPKRDLNTREGVALTMVNPAFMTRQLAELAQTKNGIRMHITSENPIRPQNGPDAWEKESLERFMQGLPERLSLVPEQNRLVYRYMAPLFVVEPCLKCHEVQGYKLGDLRGGISVTMPAAELLEARAKQTQQVIGRYLIGILLVGAMLQTLLHLIRRFVRGTRQHEAHLEAMIRAKTRQLQEKVASLNVANARLDSSHQTLNTILATTLDGFWCVDLQGRLLNVNETYARMSGYDRSELVGKNISALEASESATDVAGHIQRLLKSGADIFETVHRKKDGSPWHVEVSTTYQDIDGGRFYAFIRDISERKSTEEQIRQFAFYDTLTSLPNRRLLYERIQNAVAATRRSGKLSAVLLLDLDNFKPLNDEYGHQYGDLLLIEVAKRLTSSIREIDLVARLGGDEFVVLLVELDEAPEEARSKALLVAEKIRARIDEPYTLSADQGVDVTHACSVSIGVALFDQNTVQGGDDVLKLADRAMYAAKNSGRNRVEFLNPA